MKRAVGYFSPPPVFTKAAKTILYGFQHFLQSSVYYYYNEDGWFLADEDFFLKVDGPFLHAGWWV